MDENPLDVAEPVATTPKKRGRPKKAPLAEVALQAAVQESETPPPLVEDLELAVTRSPLADTAIKILLAFVESPKLEHEQARIEAIETLATHASLLSNMEHDAFLAAAVRFLGDGPTSSLAKVRVARALLGVA